MVSPNGTRKTNSVDGMYKMIVSMYMKQYQRSIENLRLDVTYNEKIVV